jgi:hypothetical protein
METELNGWNVAVAYIRNDTGRVKLESGEHTTKTGYSSYRVVILTINITLSTTFQHIYWYTIRVSAIRWPSSVVLKSLLYGLLFGNTMCVIIQ